MEKTIFFILLGMFFIPFLISPVSADSFERFWLIDDLDDYKAIIEDKYGDQYLIEYGIGCLSLWRYENSISKRLYIDIGGSFLDGISDRMYLLDTDDDCKIWDVQELNSSGYSHGSDIDYLTVLADWLVTSCHGVVDFDYSAHQATQYYNDLEICIDNYCKDYCDYNTYFEVANICKDIAMYDSVSKTVQTCQRTAENIQKRIEEEKNKPLLCHGEYKYYDEATRSCQCGDNSKLIDGECIKEQIIIPNGPGQILGSAYSADNSLGLQSGWLIKNREFVEVFSVDLNLCLHWIVNEDAAEKFYGPTWNQYGVIKEFDSIPVGYKFCDNIN